MSRNTIGLPGMSGKTDCSPINKHQNTGPTDNLKLAVPQKVNKNSFIVSIPKVFHGRFPTFQSQHFKHTEAMYRLCKLKYIVELSK